MEINQNQNPIHWSEQEESGRGVARLAAEKSSNKSYLYSYIAAAENKVVYSHFIVQYMPHSRIQRIGLIDTYTGAHLVWREALFDGGRESKDDA